MPCLALVTQVRCVLPEPGFRIVAPIAAPRVPKRHDEKPWNAPQGGSDGKIRYAVGLASKTQTKISGGESEKSLIKYFEKELFLINEALERSLGSEVPLVREIGRYSVLAAGKRLRPLLFILSSRTSGRECEDIYSYSAVFEIIHAASLIHDDILDNADFRRKKPAVGRVWGNHAAVLGGDFLYARAVDIAIRSRSFPFVEVLSRTTTRMTEGQFLESAHTDDWSTTREEYLEIVTAKTAVLISAACACGGILAEAGREQVDELARFGLNLGIAFQLIDDLLDYTSTLDVFGKPVGKDLREGKVTLPLIQTLSTMDRDRVLELEARFKKGAASEADYDLLVKKVRESKGLEEVREEARNYAAQAAGILKGLPASRAREDLLYINDYLLMRNF